MTWSEWDRVTDKTRSHIIIIVVLVYVCVAAELTLGSSSLGGCGRNGVRCLTHTHTHTLVVRAAARNNKPYERKTKSNRALVRMCVANKTIFVCIRVCVCVCVFGECRLYILQYYNILFYSQGHGDDAVRSQSSKPHSRPISPPTHPPTRPCTRKRSTERT